MTTKPKRKRKTAEDRRDETAAQVVGQFMLYWNILEMKLSRGIGKLCELDDVSEAAICANLNFQSKMGVVVSLCSLYLDEQPKKVQEAARFAFNKCFEINSGWRNVVAHNMFIVGKDGWPAPGLDDTDLSESGLPLELHRA